ncbi:MAG: hypothetical protein ACWA6U_08030 [Breznakibacter sp.]
MELNELLALIDTNINTKVGDEKITGAIHNMVLHNVVSSLIEITSTGFGGTIGVDDNPGVPVKPIYFLADEKGTYTYCGGVAVSELPSFIAWNGTAWSVKPFSTPQGVGDASQCQGLAKPGDPMPLGKELGDWYVFIGGGRLNWQGLTSNKAGIVYVKSLQGGGTSQVLPVWEHIYFGNDRHYFGLATPETQPVGNFEAWDYYLVLSAGDYSKFAPLTVNSVTGPGILFYLSLEWHFQSFGVEGKIGEAPADNKSYVRKNKGWAEIPTEPGTGGGLASTWEASVEAIRAIATHETGMDIGDIATGIIYQYDAASMAEDDGANCLQPSNVPSSEPGRWVAVLRVSKYGHKHTLANLTPEANTANRLAVVSADGTTIGYTEFTVDQIVQLMAINMSDIGVGEKKILLAEKAANGLPIMGGSVAQLDKLGPPSLEPVLAETNPLWDGDQLTQTGDNRQGALGENSQEYRIGSDFFLCIAHNYGSNSTNGSATWVRNRGQDSLTPGVAHDDAIISELETESGWSTVNFKQINSKSKKGTWYRKNTGGYLYMCLDKLNGWTRIGFPNTTDMQITSDSHPNLTTSLSNHSWATFYIEKTNATDETAEQGQKWWDTANNRIYERGMNGYWAKIFG